MMNVNLALSFSRFSVESDSDDEEIRRGEISKVSKDSFKGTPSIDFGQTVTL